ncbi:MAG TPA: preprotein translocase subunit SecA [Candidatus Sulfotelmatobacter sp.]|jgi:preprotein translocase subunit SecA|nr:preprotein translocase subunit SecA [Candidatus Sulfotelmatobacter sp.]
MLHLINKFFDPNKREITSLQPIVDKINAEEATVKKLKNKDFAKMTEEFKARIKDGEKLMDILPEAFALVREATRQTLGLRQFDSQLMGGIVLAQGKIAEQKTGEGKTLTAVSALYLHSLVGRGVHLVTVNDYLARRDAGWMGPIFHMLGISVAAMINEQSFIYDSEFINKDANDYRLLHLRPISRKEAYDADVTYGINSEFGFDYLRDNMAQDLSTVVQRGYYYAIVDEVDSVLIDEARTPHIISAPDESPSQRYYEYAGVVDKLTPEIDYKIDEKFRTAHLTDHGIGKVEKLYGIKDIYEKDFDTVYHLEAALKARALFHREKEYIVKDNQVILVDEFTGRLLEGRRLSEGIHQAIEAKEGVPIQRESKTLATVSLQNYFRMYEKLAGMTGTALTEAEEFKKIYKLDVVVIPTYRPVQRLDHSDAVYKTNRAKYTAVVNSIEEAYKKGQPVLVGTTSIDKNEIVSELLRRRKIKHEVLNAKNHLREAEIISNAGKKGAVTVATNMAGRGVDIVLGGETQKNADGTVKKNSPEFQKWQKEHDEVLGLGGLYVIGTERHEARRIDNQLRGRSGRQGDPGASRFFVALDDDIMRLFGGDRIANLMTRFNMPEDVPLEHPLVTKSIENAQVKVEGFNFDTRKHLVEYDDVLNRQREIIYQRRRKILESSLDEKNTLQEAVREKMHDAITGLVELTVANQAMSGNSINDEIVKAFNTIIPFDDASKEQLNKQLEQYYDSDAKIEFLIKIADEIYAKREEQLGTAFMRQIEKFVMLSVIDNLWTNHLDAIDNLRQGIGLRGYAQRDPLVEYKNEAFRMFEQLVWAIDDEIVHRIYKVQVQQPVSSAPMFESHTHEDGSVHQGSVHPETIIPTSQPKKMVTNTPNSEVSEDTKAKKVKEEKKKLSRNDLCWCGSGKKWKFCHYPQKG